MMTVLASNLSYLTRQWKEATRLKLNVGRRQLIVYMQKDRFLQIFYHIVILTQPIILIASLHLMVLMTEQILSKSVRYLCTLPI